MSTGLLQLRLTFGKVLIVLLWILTAGICAFAALRGMRYPCYAIPLSAGMSIGMLLISVELVIMLAILLFIP